MAKTRARLVATSVSPTKTAAGHFATGYRGSRFGKTRKPYGSVQVRPVGRYWGVFDSDPQRGVHYWTVEQGRAYGKRVYG